MPHRNEVIALGKPAKLYALPGGKGTYGSIHTRRMIIECTKCGNTERFYGTAYTNPMIVIERQSHDKYDVVEMSYKSDGKVDEVIERCAACNAPREQLKFTEINSQSSPS
jgi:uncharacterized protein with PIN domain